MDLLLSPSLSFTYMLLPLKICMLQRVLHAVEHLIAAQIARWRQSVITRHLGDDEVTTKCVGNIHHHHQCVGVHVGCGEMLQRDVLGVRVGVLLIHIECVETSLPKTIYLVLVADDIVVVHHDLIRS